MTTRSALLALVLLACPACQSVATWGRDRLYDLSDIVDLRYGTGLGLGAHVQATQVLGAGVGYSSIWFTRNWFGRHPVEVRDVEFYGLVLAGTFASPHVGADPAEGWYEMLLFNVAIFDISCEADESWFVNDDGPPLIDIFRFGGEVFLPGVHGGVFLNVGEVFDFVFGLATFDPSGDDGQEKLPE